MWQILGISDEVEICGVCGKPELKRTVLLSDGETEIYAGTCCAAKLMNKRPEQIARKAKEVQAAVDHERQDAEWSQILHAMHYNYLKNNVFMVNPIVEKVQKGFDRVVEQTHLSASTVYSHLAARWGEKFQAVVSR